MKPVVLQLIDSFHQGGSERQAIQLTRLLHDSGRFRVRLACLNPDGILRTEIENLPIGEISSFPLTAFYNRQAFSQMRRFAAYLKANEVQVLHTHDFYTNIFGMFAGAFARVPARVASLRETGGMRSAGQLRLQRFAYSLAHRVLANSESVRAELVRQGVPHSKTSVVYNGIDMHRVTTSAGASRLDALTRLGVPALRGDTRRHITIVANMRHKVKDYPMFLRAAQQISQTVPDVAFLLAGEGELQPSLQALAVELGIEDRTYFLGRCEALAALLSVSDICVLSSEAEGFSNSILEYMAAGRPVVATNVGGASEAIVEGKSGHLVPAGDFRAMAETIIGLLNGNHLADMGNAGRAIVAEKFSLAAQLAKTEQLYGQLLSDS